MKTRIKYIKTTRNGWCYAIQVKKWIFWKTIETYATFEGADRFLNILKDIDDFNDKTNSSNEIDSKSLNNIVYEGWAVRNIYNNGDLYSKVNFYTSYPSKKENSKLFNGTLWKDANGYIDPIVEIKGEEFFGDKCLKPMKLRITIEQMEE
jgi:hypothetical protein